MVTVDVWVHPLASFAVMVYVPAVRPVAVALLPPVGVQLYVNGGVPPVNTAVALPTEFPKQGSLEVILVVSVIVGPVRVTISTAGLQTLQFASLTVML
jgi:hypothetical protein